MRTSGWEPSTYMCVLNTLVHCQPFHNAALYRSTSVKPVKGDKIWDGFQKGTAKTLDTSGPDTSLPPCPHLLPAAQVSREPCWPWVFYTCQGTWQQAWFMCRLHLAQRYLLCVYESLPQNLTPFVGVLRGSVWQSAWVLLSGLFRDQTKDLGMNIYI